MTEQTVMVMGASPNAVLAALMNRDAILADFPRKGELLALKDREYYPMAMYVELCDYLEKRLGVYAFLRVGRRMAVAVMNTAFPPTVKSVDEAITEIHAAHQLFCRPTVGAFEVVERSEGLIKVRYTAPYNCILQEGLFYEVALRYGAKDAKVSHSQCRRNGLDACVFEIRH